jgi:hypothetical protein
MRTVLLISTFVGCIASVAGQALLLPPRTTGEFYNVTNFNVFKCNPKVGTTPACWAFDFSFDVSWDGPASDLNHGEPAFNTTCHGTLDTNAPPSAAPVCDDPEVTFKTTRNYMYYVWVVPWYFGIEIIHDWHDYAVYGTLVEGLYTFGNIPSDFSIEKGGYAYNYTPAGPEVYVKPVDR